MKMNGTFLTWYCPLRPPQLCAVYSSSLVSIPLQEPYIFNLLFGWMILCSLSTPLFFFITLTHNTSHEIYRWFSELNHKNKLPTFNQGVCLLPLHHPTFFWGAGAVYLYIHHADYNIEESHKEIYHAKRTKIIGGPVVSAYVFTYCFLVRCIYSYDYVFWLGWWCDVSSSLHTCCFERNCGYTQHKYYTLILYLTSFPSPSRMVLFHHHVLLRGRTAICPTKI